ncbi:RING-H2 finger protein ATL66-like [Typha angustifolia]|uniref:RING-H2 finger protein ATL66-like n=1 Tax=Typha angustifolia TaxID=59011 RepID=UPI003C2DEA4B
MTMSAGTNLVMTVIGFAVSAMFIVFVCTRLICARIHLRASRRSFPTASRSDFSSLERGLHGLEPAVVASFPTEKFGDQLFQTGEEIQCTVCLGEYQEKDVLRILPYCGHSFHVTCIDIWLKQHSTCPVCRVSLRDSPDRRRAMRPVYSAAIRSFYSSGPFQPDPCNHAGHDSSRAGDDQRAESTEELVSEPRGDSGNVSTVRVVNGPTKSVYGTRGKHMESPSYS